jgi:hypothetical protein
MNDHSAGMKTANFTFMSVEVKKMHQHINLECKKGKAVPLQAWSGPEGSRKLRFPDFMTIAQDGGKVVSPMHRPHLAPENSLVLISVRG